MEVLPILGQHTARSRNMWVFPITSTLYKNRFQYAGIPLTEPINQNALSLATFLSIAPFKLFLTVLAVIVPGLVLCVANFIDKCKWCCAYTDLEKNIYNLHLMQSTD